MDVALSLKECRRAKKEKKGRELLIQFRADRELVQCVASAFAHEFTNLHRDSNAGPLAFKNSSQSKNHTTRP